MHEGNTVGNSNAIQAMACGVSVLIAGTIAAGVGIGAEPLEAKASIVTAMPEPQPGIPNAQPEPQTWCQWSYERGRKVVAFGNDVQQWRVKVRGTGTIKLGMVQEDAQTPPADRTWIELALPKGTAEDDIRKVSCKVAGKWRKAEPS
jgi:hypothetical protein